MNTAYTSGFKQVAVQRYCTICYMLSQDCNY